MIDSHHGEANCLDKAPRQMRLTMSCAVMALAIGWVAIPSVSAAQEQLQPQTLPQTAAGTNRPLQLAEDSPFRDPDIIYLEADELINDEAANRLTALGEVEGRYQDRTLRADRVDYDLGTGLVLATGNVVLIDATGDVQFADKLELSDELQAGTASNFTARLANGGTSMARFVSRGEDGRIDLYNATYTACEICTNSEGDTESPTWRLRARRVRQDEDTRTIRYKDAVIELFGLPVFYTPFLAHPDPSQDRASGLLAPNFGYSDARNFELTLPYYWAVDDYSELIITPHIFSGVNPLLELQGRRKFHTGEINAVGSFTYETLFDRRGRSLDDPTLFVDPADAEDGDELSGHIFLDGYFRPNNEWSYGYSTMLVTDDNYFRRYDISSSFESNGLINRENNRNTTQAFIAGQGENYRVSALAVGFQDLNTRYLESNGLIRISRDDGDLLPIIAPKIQGEYYLQDPALGGRLRVFGDAAYLTRDIGNDYGRASAGLDYSKTWIAPGGIEVKPFVWGRFDQFDFQTDGGTDVGFNRTVGQIGTDIRYPFLKRGRTIDWIVEPRILVTQSLGNAKTDSFINPDDGSSLFEDGDSPELDYALLFEPNKSDGFDFFQEGLRVDVGGSVKASFDIANRDSHVAIFAGQSFSSDVDNPFAVGTGLARDNSDYIGQIDLQLGRFIQSNTRLRYDDERSTFSRIETSLGIRTKYIDLSGRYYKLNSAVPIDNPVAGLPPEEISGQVRVRPFGNWSARYSIVRDLDTATTRRQLFGIGYEDDCTAIELFYQTRNQSNNLLFNQQSFGVRITLATLGSFGSQ